MPKSLSLSFDCGCSFTHNSGSGSSANTTVTLCGPASKNHRNSDSVIILANQITLKLAEFQRATGN